MKLPWLQVADQVFPLSNELAGLLGLDSPQLVRGMLLDLWHAAMGWGDPAKAPEGIITGTLAAQRIGAAMGWRGSLDLLITALVEIGFLERLPDGFRVRGFGRYKSAFFQNRNLRADGTRRRPYGGRTAAVPLDVDVDGERDQKPPPPTPSDEQVSHSPPEEKREEVGRSPGDRLWRQWQHSHGEARFTIPLAKPKGWDAWAEKACDEAGGPDNVEWAMARFHEAGDTWAREKNCSWHVFKSPEVYLQRAKAPEPRRVRL